VPDDVGGQPFPDGDEPEYRHHGGADDEFASVVLDEHFVRSAEVHEPSAMERILAASHSPVARKPQVAEESSEPDDGEPEEEAAEADEGRFDRSDYTEYVDLGDLSDPAGPGSHRRRGAQGFYELPADDTPFGRDAGLAGEPWHRRTTRWDPALDAAEEHGSDHDYASPYRPAAWRSRRGPGGSYGPHGAYGERGGQYGGHERWQRPVAWVLAVITGIGLVALAMSAVYLGGTSPAEEGEPSPPPATSGAGGQEDPAGER